MSETQKDTIPPQRLPYELLSLEGGEIEFHNPRLKIEQSKIKSLSQQIESEGLLYPLIVWKPPGEERYITLDGGRRYRAIGLLIKAGKGDEYKSGTPVREVFADSLNEARAKAIIANDREPLSSFEITVYMAQMKADGWQQKEIAKRLNKSPTWVSRQLKAFGKCTDEVKLAWQNGKLPDDDVQTLSSLEATEQNKRLDALLSLRDAPEGKPASRKDRAKARKAAKGKDKEDAAPAAPKQQRPSADVLRGFVDTCSTAPKSDKLIQGISLGIQFALGDLGAGELSPAFTKLLDAKDKAPASGKSTSTKKAAK